MLSLRSTFLLFVLFLAITGSLVGQRSIYQDAMSLAQAAPEKKTVEHSPILTLEFKPADPANNNLQVFRVTYMHWDGVEFLNLDSTSFPSLNAPLEVDHQNLSYFGLTVYNASVGDSVTVRDGTVTTTFDLSILELPEGTPTGLMGVMPTFHVWREYKDKNNAFDSLSISFTLKYHSERRSQILNTQRIALEDEHKLAKVFTTLGQNVRLKEGQTLEGMTLGDISQNFATNPFIDVGELLPQLNGRDTFLISDFGKHASAGSDLYSVFPYLRALHGDSSLTDDELSVGVDDVSSYRQRIVTAQNRLEDANSAFERQRKKGGLLDVNTVAVGLSDFIAERAQEELNLTFFNRFKENLAKDSELTVLFPATRNLLNKFEISNYKVFLAHARETFNADLDNLGVNISGILNLPKYQRFKNDPNVFNLALIYDIANAAYQEKTVEEIILTTHQRLIERQLNLSESITQAIADSLYLGRGGRGPDEIPVLPFREDMQQYFREMNDLSRSLNNSIAALSEPAGDTIFTFFADQVGTPKELANYIRHLNQPDSNPSTAENDPPDEGPKTNAINLQLVQQLAVTANNQINLSEYGPRKIKHHGQNIDNSFLPHNVNILTAYLKGHEYYGYYLQDYSQLRLNGLEAISQEEPMSYLAKGLDISRSFLEIPFEELSRKYFDEITDVKATLIGEQRKAFDDIGELFFMEMEKLFAVARFHLDRQMIIELDALQRAVGKPVETDRFLVALALFRNEVRNSSFRNEWYINDTYVTKSSIVDGSNRVLDRLEQEWERLMGEAMAYHGSRVSKISSPRLNPDYTQNEAWGDPAFAMEYFLGSKRRTEAEEDILRYFRFTPATSGNRTVREILSPWVKKPLPSYTETRARINGMKPNAMVGFEKIDGLLQKNKQQIEALGAKRRRLQRKLDSLETATVPNLVKARSNAKALASAVELSAHTLFAFRDYSQLYDTLFYLDTQRVEITVQQTDKTGMVHTYKKDSFLVERTPVPGTADPIPVARWITRRQFDAMRRDPQAWNIFLGLLYQRLNSVDGGPRFSPRGVATLATQFLTVANEIQESQDKLRFKKGTNPGKVGVKEYFPFIRSTVDLLNIVLTTPIIGDSAMVNKRASALGKITEISNETLSLYENIDVREYGNAILNATELLRIITNRDYTQTEFDAMTKVERKQRLRTQRQVAAIFKYGTFMAEMINARSSDQVKTILKSTTLPPGSSRIKREVLSNITINSYLGAGLGRDHLLDAPMDINADAFGAALSVPIGLTYSFSPGFLNNRSSFSLHVPLLDLGAITAYRSNPNGETANINALPELEWKNLFSPGAYLVYNFADSPFSLGVGGQYGPQLRQLNQANGDPIFLNSWRFPMVFASIDVPFYNLHTGPRKIVVK